MNLIGCWFSATPCCHGTGGLVRQFFGEDFGSICSWGFRGSFVVCWDCVGYVLKGYEFKGRICCYAYLHAVSLVGTSAALKFLCGIVVHLLLRTRRLGDGQSCSIVK
ncbi:molybdate transporter 1 [Forsythia ovata]|uniref:Molybdate transporter 1 n=1 Tax=Forsythia ovata TaxID=205694 RepID=A0ABD1R410_9LAMI